MPPSRVAICYWGLTRTTTKVYKTHQENITEHLKKHNINYDIYLHSWNTNRPMNWDKIEKPVNKEEYKYLNPTQYRYDDQDVFEETIIMSDYFDKETWEKYDNNINGEWHPQLIKNHIFALESMKRATIMCLDSGVKYEYVIYVRPDVMIHDKLPIDILDSINEDTICIPNFEQWEGYNDRFAIVPFTKCIYYGSRIDSIKDFRKTNGRITSEKFLKYIVDKHFKEVKYIDFKFDMVRSNNIEWIDSILFNGEEIIKLRLKYLYNVVSRFYICEQRYTHQGTKKEELYIDKHKDWFEPYMDKITFLIDEECHNETLTENAWVYENRHRNYAVPYILDAHDKFICTVCDCDEIPNKMGMLQNIESIYNNSSVGVVKLQQDCLYYNFNWFVCKWSYPFIISDKLLRHYKDLQRFRSCLGPENGSIEGGWHLSYFMSVDEIVRKIQSFGHREFNSDKYKDYEYIMKCINEGYDLYRRTSTPYSRYDTSNLPKEFLEWYSMPLR
jgi:hypothetical protein